VGSCHVGVARIVQDRAVVADEGGKPLHVDAELADQLPPMLGIHRVELEGDAVAGQQVPQGVAARRPLLADDPIDHMMGSVGDRPGAERLLHLRVQPLLGGDPALHQEEVDPAQRRRPPQCRQLAEGNTGVVAVHRHQQHPAGVPMQQVRPLQELHAVQVQVGCHQRDLLAAVCQSLQDIQTGLGRIGGQDVIVGPEAASQRRLGRGAGLGIGIRDQQRREPTRGRVGGPIVGGHGRPFDSSCRLRRRTESAAVRPGSPVGIRCGTPGGPSRVTDWPGHPFGEAPAGRTCST
jgi:hypothetical protein